MGKDSKIEWTSHTFNPWWGCQKVSEGCRNCYALSLDHRFGGNHWGPTAPRKSMSEAHWKKPILWNKKAEAADERHRVFCASMADVFERHQDDAINRELDAYRSKLWALIEKTQHLDWLLLTKRPENHEMVPLAWQTGSRRPPNVWLGTTAENQEQADLRIPHLLSAKWAAVRFVSYEPALGPIQLLAPGFLSGSNCVNWVIAGAESGPQARPMLEDWAREVRDECKAARVPFFFKQRAVNGKKISLPELDGVVHAEFPEKMVCLPGRMA